MSISIVLRFGQGNFERDGFPVSLRVLENERLIYEAYQEADSDRLPAAPAIPNDYEAFRVPYNRLGETRGLKLVEDQTTHASYQRDLETCRSAEHHLEAEVARWFEHSSFQMLKDRILSRTAQVPRDQAIPIIIDADTHSDQQNTLLRKLPWHLWRLFIDRPNAEPVLGARIETRIEPFSSRIRILAIFGSSEGGLELNDDEQGLRQLEPLGAEIHILREPTCEQIHNQLWDNVWDILFFAGHSASQDGCTSGLLQISAQQTIPIHSLRQPLVHAVHNGLKLAIFNSCDGLGIARELIDLMVPSLVVMREPVPDLVARKFLRHFLNDFSKGRSLYRAVQQARKRLQAQEYDPKTPCPAASWLPIVCQSPNQPELTWSAKSIPSPPPQISWRKIALIGAGILLLSLLGWCTQQKISQVPTPPVVSAIDNLPISRGDKALSSSTPLKQKGIEAFRTGDYKAAETFFTDALKEQRNDPETLIYKNNAIANLAANRLRIAVSVPITGEASNVAAEMLRGVAQVQDQINADGNGKGINGAMLEVVIADDRNDREIAKQIAKHFVDDPTILAVVGHNASDVSIAAADIYKAANLVMITPTSFAETLGVSGDQNYIFRMVPSTREMATRLADYAIKAQKRNVVVCYDSQSADNDSFKNQLAVALSEQGGKVLPAICDFANPSYNPNALMQEIRKARPDAIALAPHVNRIARAIELAKANQAQFPLFGSPTMYTYQTLKEGQSAVEGMVIPAAWHPQAYPSFASSTVNLWGGDVSWRTATSYDATEAIRVGLQLQQSPSRSGLQQVLRGPNFAAEGAGETVRFDAATGERKLPVQLVRVKADSNSKSRTGFDFEWLDR